jgi:excisionase family DNA binding protein
MLSDSLKLKIKNLPAILSIRETADFCSVAYLTVYRLISRGQLPAWKDDEGNWCVARSDLLTYCSRNSNL